MSRLDWALWAAAQGHPVLPLWGVDEVRRGLGVCRCPSGERCHSPGKHPVGQLVPSGLKDASRSEEQLRAWWQAEPGSNVGVRLDGHVVLDVDLRSGGAESYAWLDGRQDSPLRHTRRVETGNGWHEYYRLPEGVEASSGRLLDGLDLKGGPDAYVVGPGSTHGTGVLYALKTDVPCALATPPLYKDMGEGRERERARPGGGSEEWKAPKISEGGRNDFLVAEAARLRNAIASPQVLEAALRAVNEESCVPPESDRRIQEIASWVMTREGALSAADVGTRERMEDMLLRPSQLRTFEDPGWDVEGVLVERSLTVLYGMGGSYKSFLALDWALCRAAGTGWFEREVKPGKALYIAAEGVAAYGKRTESWLVREGLDWDAVEDGFRVYPKAVNLVSEQAEARAYAEALVELVVEGGYDLLVVDTLRKAMPGGDENAVQDMGRVYELLERVKQLASATVLVIHHANKGGGYRGSSSIYDDADAVFRLRRVGGAGSGLVNLQCDKQKDAEPFEEMRLELEERRRSLAIVGCGGSEAQVVESINHATRLYEEMTPGVEYDKATLLKATGLTDKQFRTAREDAQEAGWLETEGATSDRRYVRR